MQREQDFEEVFIFRKRCEDKTECLKGN